MTAGPDRKFRIAIVDDDRMVATSIAALLGRAGYSVEKFTNPREALDFLNHQSVDVLISDISMPGMSGLEMLAQFRKKHPNLPAIFITGVPQLDDTIRAMELGAFRYLAKPIERSHLLSVVDEAIKWGRLTRAVEQGPTGAGREAIDRSFESALGGLLMVYQPIVGASTRKSFGYEALMRSTEPALPSPPAILEAAEKLGRLHELGRRVRAIIASQASAQPYEHAFFVNLHPADLADPQLYEPTSPLSEHASSVVLELTERASLESISEVEKKLGSLRQMGFRVAVDDLGAGYAGLSYFARVKPDIIKIDMSLTRTIDRDPVKQRVVASMCTLARDLGMLVVAEGIETESEFSCVADLGADLVQGYLIARPAPYPSP